MVNGGIIYIITNTFSPSSPYSPFCTNLQHTKNNNLSQTDCLRFALKMLLTFSYHQLSLHFFIFFAELFLEFENVFVFLEIVSEILSFFAYIQALTSRSNHSNHIFSPSNHSHRLPLIQSKTTNVGYNNHNNNNIKHFEQPIRSKTWDEEPPNYDHTQMLIHQNIINQYEENHPPMYQHFNSTPNTPLRKPLTPRKAPQIKIHSKSRTNTIATKRGQSHGFKVKTKMKLKNKHKPFRVDRDTDDEDNDSQLPQNQRHHHQKILSLTSTSVPSIAAGSASDRNKHPFGFHHDQQPRRYIRKLFSPRLLDDDEEEEEEEEDSKENKTVIVKNNYISSPENGLISGRSSPNPISLGLSVLSHSIFPPHTEA